MISWKSTARKRFSTSWLLTVNNKKFRLNLFESLPPTKRFCVCKRLLNRFNYFISLPEEAFFEYHFSANGLKLGSMHACPFFSLLGHFHSKTAEITCKKFDGCIVHLVISPSTSYFTLIFQLWEKINASEFHCENCALIDISFPIVPFANNDFLWMICAII